MLAAPSQVEFHSRVLRLNIFIAKHCTVHASSARELASPLGLLKFPRGCICHPVVNATRGDNVMLFLHLVFLRRSFSIHTGSDKSSTVDFVALNRGKLETVKEGEF